MRHPLPYLFELEQEGMYSMDGLVSSGYWPKRIAGRVYQ